MADSRKQLFINRAKTLGSSAKTVAGAGKYILCHTKNTFELQNQILADPAQFPALSHRRRLSGLRLASGWLKQRRNQRLVRRYAGLARLPRYLSNTDRKTITESNAHRDITKFHSVPDFAQGWYITEHVTSVPRMEKEIAAARQRKGKLVQSPILARDSDQRHNWGRLQVHGLGTCVAPNEVGIRETGSNTNWNKRSTLRRYADYCCITPVNHPNVCKLWYVDADKTEHIVLRSQTKLKIVGEPAIYTVKPPPATLDPWPVHVQRRMLRLVCPPALRVEYDRDAKKLMLIDSTGEHYHQRLDFLAMSGAKAMVRDAITAFRKRRAEKIESLNGRAAHIYVALEDSYEAGNCQSMSDAFAKQLWEEMGAQGPCAVRADIILAARNDSYTRRACAYAASRS